ncbi:type VII secretion protein EssA [Oceanobacillus senegalensis]|uniref:type VII secretion protein EssA n=1 Tax=Oceanobacillus senegalensis TaxID=1936063 RepID=UPI0015C4B30E|nr:type VII secretion protein EssA [Oceanobacillus senegalensis]
MTKKLLNITLNITLIILFLVLPPIHAEESNKKVEPNIYEENRIELNRNFQEEVSEKQPLPEEQKNLTFEKKNKSPSDQLEEKLFLSTKEETNTIATKAEQLQLFSHEEKQVERMTENNQSSSDFSGVMIMLFAIVLIVIAAMFFLIIPRLKQTHNH